MDRIELSNLLLLSSGSLALLEWIETKSFCMRGRFKTICTAVLETVKVTPGGLLRLQRWLEVRIGLLNLPVILVKQFLSTHIFGLYSTTHKDGKVGVGGSVDTIERELALANLYHGLRMSRGTTEREKVNVVVAGSSQVLQLFVAPCRSHPHMPEIHHAQRTKVPLD